MKIFLHHRYNIAKDRHGLIIINENFKYLNKRTVAASENIHLEKMFSELGINFESQSHKNLTGPEIESKVTQFVQSLESKKPSSIFIAICSHGGENDEISGINDIAHEKDAVKSKYDFTTLNRIEKIISSQGSLIGIPKVLLIQSCTGGKEEYEPDSNPTPGQIQKMSTSTSDTVIVFNTGPDDNACEKEHDFIKTLRESVGAYRKEHHLIDILTMNAGKFSKTPYGKYLSSTTQSTLEKFLQI